LPGGRKTWTLSTPYGVIEREEFLGRDRARDNSEKEKDG
jgi:hypothetical protein